MLDIQYQDAMDLSRLLTPIKEITENGTKKFVCRVQFGTLTPKGRLKQINFHGTTKVPCRLFQRSDDTRELRHGFRPFRQVEEVDAEDLVKENHRESA